MKSWQIESFRRTLPTSSDGRCVPSGLPSYMSFTHRTLMSKVSFPIKTRTIGSTLLSPTRWVNRTWVENEATGVLHKRRCVLMIITFHAFILLYYCTLPCVCQMKLTLGEGVSDVAGEFVDDIDTAGFYRQ